MIGPDLEDSTASCLIGFALAVRWTSMQIGPLCCPRIEAKMRSSSRFGHVSTPMSKLLRDQFVIPNSVDPGIRIFCRLPCVELRDSRRGRGN